MIEENRLHVAPCLRDDWFSYVHRWQNCTSCSLHRGTTNVVLARGQLPCDILLIGEAPGRSEDILGIPFIGPAGKILDALLEEAARRGAKFSYCIANTVCCTPWETVIGVSQGTIRKPTCEEEEACFQHLVELKVFAQTDLCIFFGKVASRGKFALLCRASGAVTTCDLFHPAYILRMGGKRSKQFLDTVEKLVTFYQNNAGNKGKEK